MSLSACKRMSMEQLVAVITLGEAEADGFLLYCTSDGVTDILKNRTVGGHGCSLIGRCLRGCEVKLGEFFRVSTDTHGRECSGHHIPPACCPKTTACRAEVKIRLPHDAARPAQCRCATLMCVTIKKQSHSKLQLRLLRSALRTRKRYCMVVKNQGLRLTTCSVTRAVLCPRDCIFIVCVYVCACARTRVRFCNCIRGAVILQTAEECPTGASPWSRRPAAYREHALSYRFFNMPFNIILLSTSRCDASPPKTSVYFSLTSRACHMPRASLASSVSSTDHEAPHHIIFSTVLILPPPEVHLSSAASCTPTPVATVPLLKETSFYSHMKRQAKLRFCML
jgi:hypothetical protein